MSIPEKPLPPAPSLPRRLRVTDSLQRSRTLDDSPAAWACLAPAPTGAPLLLLGLGPAPLLAPPFENSGNAPRRSVAYLEALDMTAQCPSPAERGVPANWQRLTPEDLTTFLESAALTEGNWPEIWLYSQEPRLFPDFWGPLLGALRARLSGARRGPEDPTAPVVLLPGEESGLLIRELEAAFAHHGLTVARLPVEPEACLAATAAFLKNARPTAFFSVNLQGLDSEGALAHLLEACDVPVAVWFVDNPWHCLSRLRLPWWRRLALFVTDESFIQPLQRHGATRVNHLPLAAWYTPDRLPSHCNVEPDAFTQLRPLTFVGRSTFPDRDAFFAGCRTPAPVWKEAMVRLGSATPPHAHWWSEKLAPGDCWPGHACREAGWGAEQCSSLRRALWLAAAAPHGLTVFGDQGWLPTLQGHATADNPPDLRPPLDYYGALPRLYATARYSLNATSLLLPAGLNQRHFDVWMAGGFLLTDATPGLTLFDPELVREVALPTPAALAPTLRRLEADPALRPQIASAWRNEILRAHTYVHRVGTVLEQWHILAGKGADSCSDD